MLSALRGAPRIDPHAVTGEGDGKTSVVFTAETGIVARDITTSVEPGAVVDFLQSVLSSEYPPKDIPGPSRDTGAIPAVPTMIAS